MGQCWGELLVFKQMHSRIGADVLGDQGEQRKITEYGGKRIVSSSSDIKDEQSEGNTHESREE